MKRYVSEPGSDVVRDTMARASAWFTCRIAFVESVRAIGIASGERATRALRDEWPTIAIVEVDQDLAESAAVLTMSYDLRSLDALHLAAALILPREELVLSTWDRRLHAAARAEGIEVVPDALA